MSSLLRCISLCLHQLLSQCPLLFIELNLLSSHLSLEIRRLKLELTALFCESCSIGIQVRLLNLLLCVHDRDADLDSEPEHLFLLFRSPLTLLLLVSRHLQSLLYLRVHLPRRRSFVQLGQRDLRKLQVLLDHHALEGHEIVD